MGCHKSEPTSPAGREVWEWLKNVDWIFSVHSPTFELTIVVEYRWAALLLALLSALRSKRTVIFVHLQP